MSGAFELVPAGAYHVRALLSDWLWRRAPADAALYAVADTVAADWAPVMLPHTAHAHHGDDTVWYRLRFDWPDPAAPDDAARLWQVLRFGNAFLDAEVWLNGEPLGGHYGHFAPFAFDVTDRLRRGPNRLDVRVSAPVEVGDLRRKRHVMGVWNDWDCKPYPNKEIGYLPDSPEFEWWLPVGLPSDVTLLSVPPVVVEWVRPDVTVSGGRWRTRDGRLIDGAAHVHAVARLRNLSPEAVPVRLAATLAPIDRPDGPVHAEPAAVLLAGGAAVEIALDLTVDHPWLWWSWTHGEPNRYRLTLELAAGEGEAAPVQTVEQAIGLREIRLDLAPGPEGGRCVWLLNGRRIFPRGSNYISDFDPVRATPERFRADLALLRGANMDIVRVHAHVEPPEFYAECDRTGVLVLADLPVHFTYVWGAPEAERRWFAATVHAQAAEAAHLLGAHPAIAAFVVHNEPPWPADLSYVGAAHHAGWHRELDFDVAERLREWLPGANVIAASGDLDEHIYNGWYAGDVEDCRAMAPRFPTEFGAQALPDINSPFWERAARDWPVASDDPTWQYAGYQPICWARIGIGEPAEWETLESYIAAGQAYQAWFLRWVIDWWRIRKFRPTGGMIQFMFVDCHPAITWSVVDYWRRPKLGLAALRDAYEPTHLALDFGGDYRREHRYRLHYRAGAPVEFDLWLVNDDYRTGGEATLEWSFAGGPPQTLAETVQRRLRGPAWRGKLNVAIPAASGEARKLITLHESLPDGDWSLRATLRQNGRVLSSIDQPFIVGEAGGARQAAPLIHVPGFLAGRVYRRGSLRNLPGGAGYTFEFVNRLQPSTITEFLYLKVNGEVVPPDSITFLIEGERRGATTVTPEQFLLTDVGQRAIIEVAEAPLPPGEHELEVALKVVGFGGAVARVRDRLHL